MKIAERVLVIIFVLSFVLAQFHIRNSIPTAGFSLYLISLLYLLVGFALFNNIRLRDIIKRSSYVSVGTQQILEGAIGSFFISLSVLMMPFMRPLSLVHNRNHHSLISLGAKLLFIAFVYFLVRKTLSKNVLYTNMLFRILPIGVLYFLLTYVFNSAI